MVNQGAVGNGFDIALLDGVENVGKGAQFFYRQRFGAAVGNGGEVEGEQGTGERAGEDDAELLETHESSVDWLACEAGDTGKQKARC